MSAHIESNAMDFFAGLRGSTMLETALLLAHVPVHHNIVPHHEIDYSIVDFV